MAISNPRYNFMNLGDRQLQGEGLKSARIKNETNSVALDETKNTIANRKKANDIRQMYDQMPEQITKMEESGLFEEADKLRSSYVDTRMSEVNLINGMRNGIDQQNYKGVRSELIQSGAITGDLWPTEYSDKWFREQAEEKKRSLQKFTRTWAEQGNTFSQDLITNNGEIMWEGNPYDPASKTAKAGGSGSGSGKEFSMNASDSNAIRGGVADLYGALWDPTTNKFNNLNRDQTKEVAAITEEASRIYNANQGRVPHAEAAARAARKLGIKIRDLQRDPNNLDPAEMFAPQ